MSERDDYIRRAIDENADAIVFTDATCSGYDPGHDSRTVTTLLKIAPDGTFTVIDTISTEPSDGV